MGAGVERGNRSLKIHLQRELEKIFEELPEGKLVHRNRELGRGREGF